MSETRAQAYARLAGGLFDFLRTQQAAGGTYPVEPTWGYAFSALLGVAAPCPDLAFSRRALAALDRQDWTAPGFPFEFVRHALLSLAGQHPGLVPRAWLADRRVCGTRMTNWRLLRLVNAALDGARGPLVALRARILRRIYVRRDGLIQDELGTRSLQYHAFSLLLVCELHRVLGGPHYEDWIAQSAACAARHVLPDGTALHLGRGQEQVFGYGALIVALEYALELTHDPELEAAAAMVAARLERFQRADGSFPLVLRRRHPEPPACAIEHRPPGWYGYNRLYDYLPFLALCLGRVSGKTP